MELVEAGVADTNEHSLKHFVNNNRSQKLGRKPLQHFIQDIRNHISKAKRALELSKYDQENLRLKIEEWKKQTHSHHFSSDHFVLSPQLKLMT